MAYDQRRRELDQQIAELRAKIAAGAGDVGTASYILRGDTALMDRAARAEQDAIDRKYRSDQAAIERAIREAESEKQRAFQAAENKASRENTLKIAEMSRASVKEDKEDEWVRELNKTRNRKKSIEEELNKDPNNLKLREAFNDLTETENFFSKKLGFEPKETMDLSNLGQDNESTVKSIDIKLNDKSRPYTNAIRDELLDIAKTIPDPDKQAEVIGKILNKSTKEQDAARKAAADEKRFAKNMALSDAAYDALSQAEKDWTDSYAKANPEKAQKYARK